MNCFSSVKTVKTVKTVNKHSNVEKVNKYSVELLDKKNHVKYVNMLFLNQTFVENVIVKRELKSKLSSYRQQDTKKRRYNGDLFIKFDDFLEKLVSSKLRCYYCKKQCLLLYDTKRDKLQWTLDRKNNYIGHYGINVVISCLECNLQKKRRNEQHFKFSKQMNIIKKY